MSSAFVLVLALIAQSESFSARPARRTLADPIEARLDTHLSALWRSARAGDAIGMNRVAAGRRLDVGTDGRVEVEVRGSHGAPVDPAALSAAGFDVVGVDAGADSVVTVRAAPSEFAALIDRVPGVASLRASPPVFQEVSEGVAATHADVAHTRGATGAKTKLAIIDTGFQQYSTLVGMGRVPEPILTRNFTSSDLEASSEHGTAVAETAHDMAPGAGIMLLKISNLSQFRKAVEFAVDHGADVLNASLGFLGANFSDGTGAAASAMNDAVEGGVLPVIAAGNHGDAHWLGKWKDSNKNKVHEFAPDDEGLTFSADAGRNVVAFLVWDDFPTSDVDLDLFVYYVGTTGDPLPPEDFVEVDSSESVQDGDQAPVEAVSFNAPWSGNYAIVVPIFSSDKPRRFAVFLTEAVIDGNNVAASSIVTPADAKHALAVGAVYVGDWGNPIIEAYSSRGPNTSGREKPELVGPDGTDNSVYTGPFFGTSSAAPHVAGGACLIKSVHPELSVKKLRKRLLDAALPLGDENTFGRGGLELGNDFFPPAVETVPFDTGSFVIGATSVTLASTHPIDLSPPVLFRFRAVGKPPHGASSSDWSPSATFVDDGLSPDRLYKWKLSTRDSADPSNTTPIDDVVTVRTLAAVPPAPVLVGAKRTSAKLALSSGANPASTEIALFDATHSTWFGADGATTSPTPLFAKANQFGTVKVVGLAPGTAYEFRCIARNKDGVETAQSEALNFSTEP